MFSMVHLSIVTSSTVQKWSGQSYKISRIRKWVKHVWSQIPRRHTPHKKMKFFIEDFFSKCDQIRRKLRIWSRLLMKSVMENFIFCAVINDIDKFEHQNNISINADGCEDRKIFSLRITTMSIVRYCVN